MILFLDTSALVKLFIEEPESDEVLEAVKSARWCAVSSIAFTEATAAFRAAKERKEITQEEEDATFRALLTEWDSFARYSVDNAVTKQAAIILRTHGLRVADAIHLATADILQREHKGVYFLAYDKKMNDAAARLVRLWTPVVSHTS